MTQHKHTFCRICEPLCPLKVELNGAGEAVKITPDTSHPFGGGFACHKGLTFLQVHQDPDRLNEPLKRTNAKGIDKGEFEALSWDDALAEIGAKLKAIQDKYGDDSVAVYMGNPVAYNSRGLLLAIQLANTIGTKYSFGATSQDTANKFAASQYIYGSFEFTIPDLTHTDFFISFGHNPKVSKGTILSVPNPMLYLKNIKKRGGKVLFVNPRKIESSNKSTGEVLQVKPDTDVYLMAALLHELDQLGAYNEAVIAKHGKNIKPLKEFVARYPAERVAETVGVSVEDIKSLAKDIAAAPTVSFHMGTGINQGRQGTLAFWLLSMLSFVTGNFGVKGGNYRPSGLLTYSTGEAVQAGEPVQTPLGTIQPTWGDLPGTLLADFIEAKERPIRALINISGNPLLTIPGESRLYSAFEELECLVSIDIYRSDTAEISDYVLPATDWLERSDIGCKGTQLEPYVQFTDAVVPAAANRKDDWWILQQLAIAMGKAPPVDESDDGWSTIRAGLARHELTLEALSEMSSQTFPFPETDQHKTTYERVVLHADKKVDCCPKEFLPGFETCEELFEELNGDTGDELKLISLRTVYMHNSWLTNMPQMRSGRHESNPLHIHPEDALQRGFEDGQTVVVQNANGEIETKLRFDSDLRRGVVAMTHGYGHNAPSLSLASSIPSANCNRLLPTGKGAYEQLSGMSWMNGIAVAIAPR